MTPQASFLYAGPVKPGHDAALRALLNTMNARPGVVNVSNELIPFARFRNLHSARALIVTDLAAADRAVYGLPVSGLPDYLVILGEVDGTEESFREELVRHAGPGLRQIFAHCTGFDPNMDVREWLASISIAPSAFYVNWVGRTVQQESEEETLRRSLEAYLDQHRDELRNVPARKLWNVLQAFVAEEQNRGNLTLTPAAKTPAEWRVRNALHLVLVPLALLLMLPFLLLYLPVYLIQLRHRERTDPAVAPAVSPAHAAELEAIENYDVTNQFDVFGSLKPGKTRWWAMRFFLWIVNYTARHIYNRGGLARVSTIHFARWVPFDNAQRMLFSSIYDGSLESYMDDFINKVGFGLNITFSNGIGYPRTRWLLFDGCKDEQVFKRVLRRHQLPTEVWYNATPGLSAANKHRNSMIRNGLQAESMSDGEVEQWLALL